MKCPFCQTENRDDQERCYHCDKDLSMLRLIVNKAKHHYNQALEFAERDHLDDAIQELKNTIELDSAMVDAHLVLGTLYAKKEMFDEAQACWKQVLMLDHRMEKAHDYINKGESAKVVFPVMTRLYRVCIALGVMFLVTLVGLALALRPDSDLEKVREVVVASKNNPQELSKAFEVFDHLIQDDKASKAALDFAVTLRDYIIQRWVRQIEMARMAIDHDKPARGIELLDKLDAEKPPEQIRITAGEIRLLALQSIFKRLNTLADAYYAGDAQFDEFMAEADKYLANAPSDDENIEQVTTLIDDLNAHHRQTLLAEATRAVSEADSTADALLQVQDWMKLHPELGDALDSLVNERLTDELEKTEQQVKPLIEQGQFDEARQQIDSLQVLYRSVGQKAPADRLDAMEAQLGAAQSQSVLEQARELFREKQWDQFLTLTDNVDGLMLDEVDLTQLEGMRKRAGESFARVSWEWFNGLDPRFESGTVSDEDAARAVRIYQRVLDNLPRPLNYARGPVLFYTASAFFKLGQVEKAAQLLAEVRRDYPKSYVMRSVDIFSEKYAEDLAPYQQVEEPETEETVSAESPTTQTEEAATTVTEETETTATESVASDEEDPTTTTETTEPSAEDTATTSS